jgi:hypothetical protein
MLFIWTVHFKFVLCCSPQTFELFFSYLPLWFSFQLNST